MSDEEKGPVPYDRFQAVAAERRALKGELEAATARHAAELAEARGQLAAATKAAEAVRAIEAERDAAKAEALHATGALQRQRAGMSVGLTDPDVIDHAEMAWSRTGEADKRQPFGEWLQAIKAAPDTAPAILRPFLAAGAGSAGAAGQGGRTAPPPGQAPPPQADLLKRVGSMTSEEYRKVRADVLRLHRGG